MNTRVDSGCHLAGAGTPNRASISGNKRAVRRNRAVPGRTPGDCGWWGVFRLFPYPFRRQVFQFTRRVISRISARVSSAIRKLRWANAQQNAQRATRVTDLRQKRGNMAQQTILQIAQTVVRVDNPPLSSWASALMVRSRRLRSSPA